MFSCLTASCICQTLFLTHGQFPPKMSFSSQCWTTNCSIVDEFIVIQPIRPNLSVTYTNTFHIFFFCPKKSSGNFTLDVKWKCGARPIATNLWLLVLYQCVQYGDCWQVATHPPPPTLPSPASPESPTKHLGKDAWDSWNEAGIKVTLKQWQSKIQLCWEFVWKWMQKNPKKTKQNSMCIFFIRTQWIFYHSLFISLADVIADAIQQEMVTLRQNSTA